MMLMVVEIRVPAKRRFGCATIAIMKVELRADFDVTDASCKECTGKSMKEWSAALDAASPANRREAIQYLYGEMGKDAWWPTTVWVEHEKHKGAQKCGCDSPPR